MPSAMEEEEDSMPSSVTKSSIEVKQLQRYYTVLRDFMAHFHDKAEIYPPNHEFTQDELSAITPKDILRWMNVKLYNREDPDLDDRPLNGSHHTLDYYKKSISYFMPHKDASWNEDAKTGNPTRSNEVNNLIKKIRQFDEETGGVKKRKSLDRDGAMATNAPTMAHTPADAKKTRASLPAGFAPGSGIAMAPVAQMPAVPPVPGAGPAAAMHGILRRMHTQNSSFIELFDTLASSLEQFKATLQASNQAIMVEMANLNNSMVLVPPFTPPLPFQMPPGAAVAGLVEQPAKHPGVATGKAVGTGTLDWQYVHPDGVRRRVPPAWQFPHGNLQEMYILWHCGDYQNRISPMKLFENTDVNFLGKRARMNLNEVKNLMEVIDREAIKKGRVVKNTMTLNEAGQCFNAGLGGFNFSATTPTGKTRNILRLKWSTLIKYNNKGSSPTKEEKEDAEEAEQKARKELVDASEDEAPHDKWWYEHADGIRRRVPSTWAFPMLGLEDMYVLWHCGDTDQKISALKLFQASDVSLQKRCKTNLSEVRAVMTIIDLEATKKGASIKTVMTPTEARDACRAGYLGLNIPGTTAEGRSREVLRMKWSSAVRLKNPAGKARVSGEDDEEDSDEVPEAEESELPEAEIDV